MTAPTRIGARLPALPRLGREVEIPVYVVHNSADRDDYFFVFDFARFVEEAEAGRLSRPKLTVWTGRDDLSRPHFARQMREAFAGEFARMRREAAVGRARRGWFGWDAASGLGGMLASFTANVLLLIAAGAGRALLSALPLPRRRSAQGRMDLRIDALRRSVDDALERVEMRLHRDLYAIAHRGRASAPMTGIRYAEWPLPDYVTEHLGDGRTSSWW